MAETYLNPVYPRSFPDPYVIKFRGEYYAYCTDFWHDGRVFGVLRSPDLVEWTEVGGAMERLATDAPFYWAPEVTYANGRFYLYYSVGNETLMELRVAVSPRPDGGFVDAGVRLSTEDFAIDGHVFTDTDGRKYLFYATDFLDHTHVGTGTVVDEMVDFYTLKGRPRPVTRAKYDWQVYDPQRKEKGGVRWHTVEGAFVLKRKGLYYEMFSGGNWQNVTYGVSFAVTDDLCCEGEWAQFSDGEKVLPILRTIPEKVIGPGHNSAVRGPNNRELYCVYHRWTENGRVLAIDRMDFAGRRLYIKGATVTPQPAPYRPTFADRFDGAIAADSWERAGDWRAADGEAVCAETGEHLLFHAAGAESFLCEFYLRAHEAGAADGALGFGLLDGSVEVFRFSILPAARRAVVRYAGLEEQVALPDDFDAAAFHLVRAEVDGAFVRVALDEANFSFTGFVPRGAGDGPGAEAPRYGFALRAENQRAGFSGFALTAGFEELFDGAEADLARRGWRRIGETAEWRLADQELILTARGDEPAALAKGGAHAAFELAVNLRRVAEAAGGGAEYGFLVLDERDAELRRFTFGGAPGEFHLADEAGGERFALPPAFAPENHHQFRLVKDGERIFFELEDRALGAAAIAGNRVKIGLFVRGASLGFEMIRLTVF